MDIYLYSIDRSLLKWDNNPMATTGARYITHRSTNRIKIELNDRTTRALSQRPVTRLYKHAHIHTLTLIYNKYTYIYMYI